LRVLSKFVLLRNVYARTEAKKQTKKRASEETRLTFKSLPDSHYFKKSNASRANSFIQRKKAPKQAACKQGVRALLRKFSCKNSLNRPYGGTNCHILPVFALVFKNFSR
jgi:hypothetical protein